MAYRVLANATQVGVGNWTAVTLSKGQVLPTNQVPDEVADHLIGHGVLIEVPDDAADNPWYDSDDPELAEVGKGTEKKKK